MSFLSDLPNNVASDEAQAQIVSAVLGGQAQIEWAPITITDDSGNELVVEVIRDAIKIEGVRVNVTAESLQKIADGLGALLLTPALSDRIWEEADVRISPVTRPITLSKQGMIDQSRDVDVKIGERHGLVADAGKDWVIVNALLRQSAPGKLGFPIVAANYGWHFTGGGGEASVLGISRVIQSVGLFHGRDHGDYSQTARAAHRRALLNGSPVDLAQIYQSTEYSHLVSHEGPLDLVRQPMNGEAPLPPLPPPKRKASGKKKASAFAMVTASAVGVAAGGAAGGPLGAIGGGILGALVGSRIR